MDPALVELMEKGDGLESIQAVVRLRSPGAAPPGARLVARFGEIATCRVPRNDIVRVWEHADVISLKAPRALIPEPDMGHQGRFSEREPSDDRRPPGLDVTGRGVVVGVVDWFCDFAYPSFRRRDGSTRLLALWDQSAPVDPRRPNPYGYGVVHRTADIDQALRARRPYEALGYVPHGTQVGRSGTHGTHVLDIAAGNGASGGPSGMAPEASLVFVHLAAPNVGRASLGNWATLLEAIDFIRTTAGHRPWVVNLSIGRHSGPHDGTTLVERALDAVLLEAPGRAIVQSAGNYYREDVHASGVLRPGEVRALSWRTDAADVTANELEIWYSSRDHLDIQVRAPSGAVTPRVKLSDRAWIEAGGERIGRIYHRQSDPNNGDHHVVVLLYPAAPAGRWEVRLHGVDVIDGRYHAWIERDACVGDCQSRFAPGTTVRSGTTGTICNGFRTIAVGAYDARDPGAPVAPFSSSGPTRDGRQKPDLLAPGVGVLAARSAPSERSAGRGLLTRKSGASMASPHVAGAVALMFEAAERLLPIDETRRALLASSSPPPAGMDWRRVGSGYLDVVAAVDEARREVRPAVSERASGWVQRVSFPRGYTRASEEVAMRSSPSSGAFRRYSEVRRVVARDIADAADDDLADIVAARLPGASLDDIESLLRETDASAIFSGLKRALPGALQGAAKGASKGAAFGPWGAAIGGLVGAGSSVLGSYMGGGSGGQPASPAGALTALAAPATAPSGQAAPTALQGPVDASTTAAAQLLVMLLRPEVLRAVVALSLGADGASHVSVGGTPVPVAAFANAIGELSARASAALRAEGLHEQSEDPEAMEGQDEEDDPADRADAVIEIFESAPLPRSGGRRPARAHGRSAGRAHRTADGGVFEAMDALEAHDD